MSIRALGDVVYVTNLANQMSNFGNEMYPVSFIAPMCSKGSLRIYIASSTPLHGEWISTLTLSSAMLLCLHVHRFASSGIRAL